ncbi:MAG TPA: putative toxin-antitoxin system toxin component, PIN family [Cyclobacteriaceae bacterium]|nr:putative toxin-antitoxin system toxin component, PIN family [Cyclobacteriaceae bacterium]
MQKIVLDTNVLVSGLIQTSFPYLIIHDLIIERKVLLCISKELFREYYLVLNRDKFSKYPDFKGRADLLLADIELIAQPYLPVNKVTVISDKDDNKLLELAEEANADYLITGNTTDFTMETYKGTKIVSPKVYWENYRPT